MSLLKIAEAEALKPLSYARTHWIPRNGPKPISPATIHRWVRKGCHGVRLDVMLLPSGAMTTEAACRQFLVDVDAARRAERSRDESALDVTDAELASVGLGGGK